MRLLLDGRMLFGVGTIVRNIVPLLARELDQLILLAPEKYPWSDRTNIRVEHYKSRLYSADEQLRFPYRLRNQVDLLHVPNFNIPLLWQRPLVVTINDLAHLSPTMSASRLQKAYVRFFIKRSLRVATRILTLSEFSRRELCREFQIPFERVIVGHCGVDRTLFRPIKLTKTELYAEFGLDRPFILAVASLRPHKNVNTILRAFHQLKEQKQIPHDLVLVGTLKGFRITMQQLELPEATLKHVKHFDFVDEQQLVKLYSSCDLFTYPSLYEGFGLPPLEAMACGAPVVVSDSASLPEVVGDAGISLSGLDLNGWVEVVGRVANDEALRRELSAKSIERAKLFPWDSLARTYLQCYRDAI